jgi:A/G-specific adenine glycosylase
MTAATHLADLAVRWYDEARRDLPWRRPGTSPWGVLVSEVMLQQTQVARVAPVYEEWLRRWPAPAGLAAEPAGEAIRAWGRLGYPRRAVRLHRCAAAVVERHGGHVPQDLAALLALPGVGEYTARAVAAFAFGHRHPVVDTNVRRLIARAHGGSAHGGAATTATDLAAVEALLPAAPAQAARASIAFMELGAVLCTARTPDCGACPLQEPCAWRGAGRPGGEAAPLRRSPGYAGTDRQVRGVLLGLARRDGSVNRGTIESAWPDTEQCARALASLLDDGLLVEVDPGHYGLPGMIGDR